MLLTTYYAMLAMQHTKLNIKLAKAGKGSSLQHLPSQQAA